MAVYGSAWLPASSRSSSWRRSWGSAWWSVWRSFGRSPRTAESFIPRLPDMAVGEERLTDASLGSSEGLEAVAEVVEAGDGLPALARAIGRALQASVAILDRSSSVLAVACASPADERAVLEAREGVERLDLIVGGTPVGELRVRPRSGVEPAPALGRALAALTALELERASQPDRASEEAVARFLRDLFQRRVTDRENIIARGKELAADLTEARACWSRVRIRSCQ